MHEFGGDMAWRDIRETSSASGNSSNQADESSLAEPHELRDAERTFLKLLELTRRGVLPAKLLPAVSNLQTALSEDPCSQCHLLALSHDELDVIFDGLSDPLQPELAVVFSSTCKGLRTPLRAALEELEGQHSDVKELCRHVPDVYDKETGNSEPMDCAMLRDEMQLKWNDELQLKWNNLNVDAPVEAMSTLGMILRANGLPKLRALHLAENHLGDAGAQPLFEGLGPGSLPSLLVLSIYENNIGPAGGEALAAALGSGAMPTLVRLDLHGNPIGKQGVAALAAPLRKLHSLTDMFLSGCKICDEGVASLVDNLGKDDFKALVGLDLEDNLVTDKGCATLVDAIKAGSFPSVKTVHLHGDFVSDEANAALSAAVSERKAAELLYVHAPRGPIVC